jgi:hypothetical protein
MSSDTKSCQHFVGFSGDEYTQAVKVFGEPDFIHRYWDSRTVSMVVPGDRVIFANGMKPKVRSHFSFDDSEVM